MKRQNVRTLSLVGCIFTYLLIGAAVFDALESQTEAKRWDFLLNIKNEFVSKYNISNEDYRMLEIVIIENKPHKAGPQWKFAGAFYFASVVLAMIGYGHSTSVKIGGKAFCMGHVMVGIPLGLVMFQSIGERLNKFASVVIRRAKQYIRCRHTEATETNLMLANGMLSSIIITTGAGFAGGRVYEPKPPDKRLFVGQEPPLLDEQDRTLQDKILLAATTHTHTTGAAVFSRDEEKTKTKKMKRQYQLLCLVLCTLTWISYSTGESDEWEAKEYDVFNDVLSGYNIKEMRRLFKFITMLKLGILLKLNGILLCVVLAFYCIVYFEDRPDEIPPLGYETFQNICKNLRKFVSVVTRRAKQYIPWRHNTETTSDEETSSEGGDVDTSLAPNND